MLFCCSFRGAGLNGFFNKKLSVGNPAMGHWAESARFLSITYAPPKTDPERVGVVRGKEGRTGRKKRPITPDILTRMLALRSDSQAGGNSYEWEMYWAACCVAFFGFLRAGELTVPSPQSYDATYHLNLADVSANHPDQPSVIHLRIKASKTDPLRKGVTVVLGATGKELCPVQALVSYLRVRGKTPGPVFRQRDGRPLVKGEFVRWVQQALQQLGLEERGFTGHSFRVGAATTAAAKGMEDSVIKAMGRWESAAYLLYIRIPPENLQQLSAKLV